MSMDDRQTMSKWWFEARNGYWLLFTNVFTHWGWVMHICVSKLTIIGSDNSSPPHSTKPLLIWPLGRNFSAILIKIHTISLKKINLNMSSGKWQPFCLGLNVLSDLLDHGLMRSKDASSSSSYLKALVKYQGQIRGDAGWNASEAHNLRFYQYPDSKVHGANMGPTWGRQDPGGPHVGPMNFAIWVCRAKKGTLRLGRWTSPHHLTTHTMKFGNITTWNKIIRTRTECLW